MKVVILAGGGGTRLFPVSRQQHPKQFISLGGNSSLLLQTVRRFTELVPAEEIVVCTGEQYRQQTTALLAEAGLQAVHIVAEPCAKNTAPAILLATKYCEQVLGLEAQESVVVAPSDHLASPQELFTTSIQQAVRIAEQQQSMVVFGVRPTQPHNGYGYIKAQAVGVGGYSRVERFVEKPDLNTACRYLEDGNYFWNSGMFCFTPDTLYREFAEHTAELFEHSRLSLQELEKNFQYLHGISIDYAVAEKSERMLMIPLACQWSDVGSWDAMYDILPKDGNGNVLQGDCVVQECSNSLFVSKERLVTAIGVQDICVVETDDTILVVPRGQTEQVKNLVDELRKDHRPEIEIMRTVYRSWGLYKIIEQGNGYKVKQIEVNPGASLSLQMHYHRSEHWVVTEGTALVVNGDREMLVEPNESTFIPIGTVHRLSNPGKIPLRIIEIQAGAYLEEDDIVRFES